MPLSITHAREQVQSGYQAFLGTLPRYEDEIETILGRVNRFDIPLTSFKPYVGTTSLPSYAKAIHMLSSA
ncbi:MAG: hypothetical protein ACJ8AG_18075 [Ktedonobacteraceae bacterium]